MDRNYVGKKTAERKKANSAFERIKRVKLEADRHCSDRL